MSFPTKDGSHDYRKELWVNVAVAIATSGNSTHKHSMSSWADFALDEFDKRFPKELGVDKS